MTITLCSVSIKSNAHLKEKNWSIFKNTRSVLLWFFFHMNYTDLLTLKNLKAYKQFPKQSTFLCDIIRNVAVFPLLLGTHSKHSVVWIINFQRSIHIIHASHQIVWKCNTIFPVLPFPTPKTMTLVYLNFCMSSNSLIPPLITKTTWKC